MTKNMAVEVSRMQCLQQQMPDPLLASDLLVMPHITFIIYRIMMIMPSCMRASCIPQFNRIPFLCHRILDLLLSYMPLGIYEYPQAVFIEEKQEKEKPQLNLNLSQNMMTFCLST